MLSKRVEAMFLLVTGQINNTVAEILLLTIASCTRIDLFKSMQF